MHIQFTKTFTTNTGTVHHAGEKVHCPTSVAEAFIFDGVAERVRYKSYIERLAAEEQVRQQANPTYATVKWAVAEGNISGRYFISATCSAPQCSSFSFDGAPNSSLENLTFPHSCGCGAPEKIPAAVCEQYRKLYRPPTKYGNDEGLALRLAAPQKSTPVNLDAVDKVTGKHLIGPSFGGEPVAGSEAGLNPLLFLPSKEEHVEKKLFGPQGNAPLAPSDEILHPLPVKI